MTENAAQPKLPPIGMIGEDDQANAFQYLSHLVLEVREARDEWTAKVDDNLNIYLWGKTTEPADDELVINEIQNAIISATDIQTKEPPAVTLEPVETGEPPTCYFAGPPEAAAQLGIPPEQSEPTLDPNDETMQTVVAPQPLTDMQADVLRQYVMAGMIKEEWLVEVNDQLVADTYQTAFDVHWSRAQIDRRNRSMLLSTNVQGWVLWLYEFDDEVKRHRIRPLSVKQTYIDPTVEDISDAAYAGVDFILDANEAKALYPDLADDIDKNAHDAIPVKLDGNIDYGGVFESRVFRRLIIELRVFWLRYQPCPMTPEMALQQGAIEQRDVPADNFTNPIENDGSFYRSEDQTDAGQHGLGNASAASEGAGQDAEGGGGSSDEGGDVGGLPADDAATALPPGVPPVRAATFLAGTDTEVDPAHPLWPTYTCTRQLTAIAGQVVDDRELEHWDIPLIHNVNIPVPGRPWGIGEPDRLRNLQNARSRAVAAMVEHTEYFKHPLAAMPQSMYEYFKQEYGTARMQPGRTLPVPDELWQAFGGKVDNVYDPPPLQPAQVQLQEMLKGEITELSGNADVLQGRAQPQVKSGKAIELLQSAASSMIGFKSQRTGDAVDRMARLMLHSLVWRLTLADLYRIISKYPPHILEAIHERARRIEWDVNVVVTSGNGVVLQNKKQQAAQDLQLGAISMETYQERAGIDTRVEKQRQKQQMMDMARAGMMQQPQQGGEPQGSSSRPPQGENQSQAGQ